LTNCSLLAIEDQVKLSDYVFQFVARQGVKHVFMLPGGGAMHLNDSLGHTPGLDFVSCLHEQAAAVAAEAYARVAHNLGVALVTTGPGGTNAVTGVAAAWLDSTPCLFISGQVKRSDMMAGTGLRQLGVQELDIVSVVRSITKCAVTVMDPATIRLHLEKAAHLARSGRPGPVWIDIPLDVQAANVDPGQLEGFTQPEGESRLSVAALREAVGETINLLKSTERPIVLAGNGIRLAGAEQDFVQLVERLRLPVLTTRLGVDLMHHDHELLVGMPGTIGTRGANFALQNSDLLLILGARVDLALIAYAPERLARAAKRIMVNIDEAEIRKLGDIIDLPVVSDVGAFIRELCNRAGDVQERDRSTWRQLCRRWKDSYPVVLPEHRSSQQVSMYFFSEVLSEELTGEDVVLPGSSGSGCEIVLTAFKVKAGQRVFHNKGTGAMGLGPPAAIGACLASGGRRTICVDGDGGFAMNMQELETVRRLALPIKFFVISNSGYASIRASQLNYFGRLSGADRSSGLTLPDVIKQGSAFGIPTARISDTASLREGIRAVLSQPGPVVCEVVTIPDEPRIPRVQAILRPDGTMVSKPLEDMFPYLSRDEFRANMIVPPVEE
jgi:acetolactate synthase-1/2/3 large subunit